MKKGISQRCVLRIAMPDVVSVVWRLLPLQVWLFQTQNTAQNHWLQWSDGVWWAVLGSIVNQEHVHSWSLLYLFYSYLPQIRNKIFVFHLFLIYNFNMKRKSCYSIYSDNHFCLCANLQNMNVSVIYGGRRVQNTMTKAEKDKNRKHNTKNKNRMNPQNTMPKSENTTKVSCNEKGRYLLIAVAVNDWRHLLPINVWYF